VNLLARRLASVAGAAVIALGIVAPAHAARDTHTDASGDVTQITCDAQGDNCTEAAAPTVTNGDILATEVIHGARKVTLFATFADLEPTNYLHLDIARIVTNERLQRYVTITSIDGQSHVQLHRPSGRQVACRGLRGTVDFTANTVFIKVPRYCLSRPRWIQAGIGNFSGDMTTGLEDGGTYDDAYATGGTADADLVLSPRIKRA
jgi:hypothetical protein